MNAAKPVSDYYKVPFREMYCHSRMAWVKGCFQCLFATAKWRVKNLINPQPDIPGMPRT